MLTLHVILHDNLKPFLMLRKETFMICVLRRVFKNNIRMLLTDPTVIS